MANATLTSYDLIIIGGGPAGLSAAVYAGREGMNALVIDKNDFGGMAAITEHIDNYPGFTDGVGGKELITQMVGQAERFGAHTMPFTEVTGLKAGKPECQVQCGAQVLQARAVLLTTGSTYRQMGVPGEDALIGKGIHFCATCDGPLYKDKTIVVVGGGNSAVQESLFLARFASSIHMLVRGPALKASDVLVKQLATLKNVHISYNSPVASVARPVTPGLITVNYMAEKQAASVDVDGVFVFVGLLPNTHGLGPVPVDARGFITSDARFATGLPGIFVAGDVRSGSTWQIASAVGEGVSAALVIREYLDSLKQA